MSALIHRHRCGPLVVLALAVALCGCVGSVVNSDHDAAATPGGIDAPAGQQSDAAANTPDAAANTPDAAANAPDARPAPPVDASPPAPVNITFFYGYFTYDPVAALPAMDGHVNVVLGWSTLEVIQQAKSLGIQPIVWLATVLPLWDTVGDHLVLKSNYLEIWNAYAAQIAPYIDDIYGFYPADEPFWAAKLSVADQDALNTAIKASFPNKPILTTFARPTLYGSGFAVPSTYDIVSFDQYGASFDSDKAGYELLKSKLSPGQRIFLLGDGFVPEFSVTDEQQWLRANKIYQAYELATTPGEPIAGILTFVWDGYSQDWPGTTGPYYIGTREMPIALEHFIAVGQAAIAAGGGG